MKGILIVLLAGAMGLSVLAIEQRGLRVHYRADQKLSAQEATELVELALRIVDRKQPTPERKAAARRIGIHLPHKAAIPALLRIVRDSKDNEDVRYWALTALSQIADNSVITLLIDTLKDRAPNIRARADEQLKKLAGWKSPHSISVYRQDISAKELDLAVSSWRQWWKNTQPKFKFDRIRVLGEY